jgi:hypothetical protein
MKTLGVLTASASMALALGVTSVSAGDFGIERRSYREEAYAPPVRERIVVERPIRERVVVERPVRERIIHERVTIERPVEKRIIVKRPVEKRIVVEHPVEQVVVRKIVPPRVVAYGDGGPAYVGEWGPGWRHRGWGGGWGRHW